MYTRLIDRSVERFWIQLADPMGICTVKSTLNVEVLIYPPPLTFILELFICSQAWLLDRISFAGIDKGIAFLQ